MSATRKLSPAQTALALLREGGELKPYDREADEGNYGLSSDEYKKVRLENFADTAASGATGLGIDRGLDDFTLVGGKVRGRQVDTDGEPCYATAVDVIVGARIPQVTEQLAQGDGSGAEFGTVVDVTLDYPEVARVPLVFRTTALVPREGKADDVEATFTHHSFLLDGMKLGGQVERFGRTINNGTTKTIVKGSKTYEITELVFTPSDPSCLIPLENIEASFKTKLMVDLARYVNVMSNTEELVSLERAELSFYKAVNFRMDGSVSMPVWGGLSCAPGSAQRNVLHCSGFQVPVVRFPKSVLTKAVRTRFEAFVGETETAATLQVTAEGWPALCNMINDPCQLEVRAKVVSKSYTGAPTKYQPPTAFMGGKVPRSSTSFEYEVRAIHLTEKQGKALMRKLAGYLKKVEAEEGSVWMVTRESIEAEREKARAKRAGAASSSGISRTGANPRVAAILAAARQNDSQAQRAKAGGRGKDMAVLAGLKRVAPEHLGGGGGPLLSDLYNAEEELLSEETLPGFDSPPTSPPAPKKRRSRRSSARPGFQAPRETRPRPTAEQLAAVAGE